MALRDFWHSYSSKERRNIAFYVAGIMFYKFGLELFNGPITTLAKDRVESADTFTKMGVAQGINQAAQCIGAIIVAPLIGRWPTRSILISAALLFSLLTTISMIIKASTGGQLKSNAKETKVNYGGWISRAVLVVWIFGGIAYGMVVLINSVIPRETAGGNTGKKRGTDAAVIQPKTEGKRKG